MSITAEQIVVAAHRWGLEEAAMPVASDLALYGNLLLAWNARLNLTSIRDEGQLIERHLLEGLFASVHHPPGRSALDFGSGAGIPGIPIALGNSHLTVTLAESQRKKASFLREALRILGVAASVHAARAELLPAGHFDAVWMRAVDQSQRMLPLAASLVAPQGSLCLLSTQAMAKQAEGLLPFWTWRCERLPFSAGRVLHIGQRN